MAEGRSLRGGKDRAARSRRTRPRQTAEALPRPRWVPAGVDFHALPQAVQAAIAETLDPIYAQLVASARDALEKSTGLTIIHLLWLELLDQLHLGAGACDDALIGSLTGREELIVRHLQLVEAKMKASYVLVRLRELRQQGAAAAGAWERPACSPGNALALPLPAEGDPHAAKPESG